MEFEMLKGKPIKCTACGKKEAYFLRDFFILRSGPPPDSIEKGRTTLSDSAELMYVKVKQCKRCRFLGLYSPTKEELNQYAKGGEISHDKFP